jgi:hypothetical protein
VNSDSLRSYLQILAREGYAATDGGKNADGSSTITHASPPWRTIDTYFGGEPYGGNEVVFLDDRAVWMMAYYGRVTSEPGRIGGIYRFLKAALADTDPQFPVRGPHQFAGPDMTYANAWDGDLEHFTGVEHIAIADSEVYTAWYTGGLVDQRPE